MQFTAKFCSSFLTSNEKKRKKAEKVYAVLSITRCLFFFQKHADQCPSMDAAIKSTLIGTLHKLCRWHILKKYKDHLSLLYKAYEKFKDELTSVLNHPLMPSEFERAWRELMEKYNLQNDEIMKALWADRKEWISAYYKEVFCARMTSTQRSESMNRILKRNFVKERHDLHIFASQVDRCIQTRKGVEHAETIANEVYKTEQIFQRWISN